MPLIAHYKTRIIIPSTIFVLVSFFIHTFIYPWVIYELYYPETTQATPVVDLGFIEEYTKSGIGIAVSDSTSTVRINLDGKLLELERDLSSFSFSGKVLRLVDEDDEPLTGFTYEARESEQGRDSIRFTRDQDESIEFKFYDDSYIIRATGVQLGALQVADVSVNVDDGKFFVGDVTLDSATATGGVTKQIFAPAYQIEGIYVDGEPEQMRTSRDSEIGRVFKEISDTSKVSSSSEKGKFVPEVKASTPKYSFVLVDKHYQIGAMSINIPKGKKQEIKFVYDFKRSIGSDSYISADTFQGDPTAVDEILKMGGLDFIKQNSIFYNDTAKVGYLDFDMKKFVELKLTSETPQYIGKRGKDIIYQGKEDTYIYTLSPGAKEKIKETILLREARATNSYTYEVIGNYRLEKNQDGSVSILGQNLNKSGLTETCSDEYYETEQTKRLEDIKNMSERALLAKYGKEKVSEVDTTEFCISPKILKEKKKEIPYDVPVFRLERPVTFGADESEVPLDVAVTLSGSEVTYSFDTTTIDKSLFPLRFDPTLTTDAELRDADISNIAINGSVGLGTTPTGGPLGSWTGTTSMTTARSSHGVGVYNGYIYAIGGYDGTSYLSSNEYAPINSNGTLGTWTATTSMTTARIHHGVTVYNGYIYAIGGLNLTSTEYAPINSNGTLGTWTATTSMSTTRTYHGVTVYNGYIYAIGGYFGSYTGPLSSTEYAPINANGTLGTWTATTSMTTTRVDHGVDIYNGYIYAIGGYDGTSYLSSNEYAPINSNGTLGTWTATTSMTITRSSPGVAIYNGYIYAVGGHNGAIISSNEYAPINSNGTLGTWTATTSITITRTMHGVAIYNGYIYALGGNNGPTLATTEYARIGGIGGIGNWTASTSMTTARSGHGLVAYNGYLYSIGGRTGSISFTNTTEYAPINPNGTLGAWVATTSMTTIRAAHGVVVYNGYIYAIAGTSTGVNYLSSTEYAPINSNGTLGTWTATTSLITTRYGIGVAAYNGYIYVVGGTNFLSLSSTEYAPINSGGSLGSWVATTSMTIARQGPGVAIYNGYIYAIGGPGFSSTEYAPINSGGSLGSWVATTSMTTPRQGPGVAIYNGYIYAIGGPSRSSTEYAPINSGGSLGAWIVTTSMTTARQGPGFSCVYNGYIYAIGGWGSSPLSTTEYAPIANNLGTLGSSWTTTTSMGTTRSAHKAIAYNGYIYSLGGYNGAYLTTVQYAAINTNGTIGAWTATTSIAASRYDFAVAAYNGYMYIIGGWNGTTANATTAYAVINTNGTLGTWTATTSMTTGRAFVGTAIHNGYIYAIGGWNAANLATTEYAPINSNGTLGVWAATTSMTVARLRHGVVTYNGYIYALGYSYGSAAAKSNTTEYAPINSNGTLGTWTATTRMIIQRGDFGVAVFGGYIYVVGGTIGTSVQTTISEFAPINSNGTLGNWSENRKLASTRYGNQVVAYNGFIYTLGGYTGAAYLATVEYTPINGLSGLLSTWTNTTSISIAQQNLGVITYNGYIYALGGRNNTTYRSTVEYAPINSNGTLGVWAITTSMISGRSALGVATYNGYVYAIGGWNGSSGLSSTEYAPINANGTLGTWTATTSMTTSRMNFQTVSYNGYIYAIGGLSAGVLSSTEYAPINTNGTLGTWTTTMSMTMARQNHGIVAYNGYIYAIAGQNFSESHLATTEYAPINSNGTLGTWTATSRLIIPRMGLISVVYNGYIYAIGTYNYSTGFGFITSVEYTPINSNGTLGTWAATTSMPTTRVYPGAVTYNGFIYVISGSGDPTTMYSRINHTPQSAIQQLWHKTFDKGAASTVGTYVSIKYNTNIDSDTYIRYRLWNSVGTTASYRSQWIPLESYKTGGTELKVLIPAYGISYRYLDFEIMRVSGRNKTLNNIVSIGYGLNSCLACSGVDVIISSACVLTTNTTCVLNNIEITSAGTLEIQSPATLDFDTIGHKILIRNGGQFLIRNGSKMQ